MKGGPPTARNRLAAQTKRPAPVLSRGRKNMRRFLMFPVATLALGLLPGCDAVAGSLCSQDGVVSIAAKLETFGAQAQQAQNWEKTWNTIVRPANVVRDIVVDQTPINGDPATYCSATHHMSLNTEKTVILADGRFTQEHWEAIERQALITIVIVNNGGSEAINAPDPFNAAGKLAVGQASAVFMMADSQTLASLMERFGETTFSHRFRYKVSTTDSGQFWIQKIEASGKFTPQVTVVDRDIANRTNPAEQTGQPAPGKPSPLRGTSPTGPSGSTAPLSGTAYHHETNFYRHG
jgi:hypothetical protein